MRKWKIATFIFAVLTIAIFLQAQYHVFHRSNRYWSNAGVFSTDGMIQSWGTDNALRLSYSGAYYTEMVANDEGEFEISKTVSRDGETESSLQFWTDWEGADEARKGVINIFASRDNVLTSPGGSPDMGMQIYVRNNAANASTYHLRGLESIAANKDSGATIGEIIAAYFSTESRSGTESAHLRTIQVNYDQSGNVNTSHTGVYVFCNSQSNVGTNYGIQVTTSAYNQTREYAIFIDSNAGSWTNGLSFNGTLTNAFDFESTDGTNAAGYNAGYTGPAAWVIPDGYIKVDIGGNVQYIYTWTTLPT